MNTNTLKKFAQQARRKLLEQIEAKLDMVLTTDSAELREKSAQISKLREAINITSREQVIEKVAYTWFNRLMALRFMDANDYQPTGISIVTPREGYTTPEILEEAKQGMIPDDLQVNRQHIFDVLDGKIPASNPQNEAYKELLTGACNHLHTIFPFLFERINDYTELLLPDDLTSEFSIVHDVRTGMTNEDCREVEIIGWLYQFYISEKKDEVFASKSKVKKEDIPAATQLFTPRWIVEYMVQNTVGKLWLQNHPDSGLRKYMPYYIESASVSPSGEMPEGQRGDYLKVNAVEELTLLDQACGSGHILVYGFELLSKIYEEEGYNPSEIPQLIIEKNLYGFEIDERAAQLAGLALLMKARSYQRRFFRKEVKPNILYFRDYSYSMEETEESFKALGIAVSDEILHDMGNMQQATNFGSLIIPRTDSNTLTGTLASLKQKSTIQDVFLTPKLEALQSAVSQLILLGKKYHCVVANPPYMGGGKMNKVMSDWVKINYPNSKADLFSCFIERSLYFVPKQGFNGLVTMESWMFLSSFENFRKELIKSSKIHSLSHFGWHIMRIAFGTVAFILENVLPEEEFTGVYSYMEIDNIDNETERPIQFPVKNNGRYNTANQKDFEKIPGSPIGYWVGDLVLNTMNNPSLKETTDFKEGITTANNDCFLRLWFELSKNSSDYSVTDKKQGLQKKWIPYNKGGSYRKWYGNRFFLIDWSNSGEKIKKYRGSSFRNPSFQLKEGGTFSALGSASLSARYSEPGFAFDSKGTMFFSDNNLKSVIAFLNSKVCSEMLKIVCPTLDFRFGTIQQLPFLECSFVDIDHIISYSMEEWNSRETSWDFLKNELIRIKGHDLEEALDLYQQYWTNKFYQLHQNEEELNAQFIEIYGLQEELTPDVPLEDITILKEELDQKALKKISESYKSGWELKDNKWHLNPNTQNLTPNSLSPKPSLPFNAKEVFSQFISYAVGCMFGRYSLDKEGLILANQGETLQDYKRKVFGIRSEALGVRSEALDSNLKPNTQNLTPSFLPDDDNIIPVLDDDWFEDDITGRFTELLKVSFGKENLEKNLAFVKECIGMDIRKYFIKEFYKDHIKRYKKRPIYWMFSSPKGSFNVLIYMHRYTPDTLSRILNGYLNAYREKLNTHIEQLDRLIETGTAAEQTRASKEKDKMKLVLLELQEYERDILYPIASERIAIDLDDGVLVNYNKFGKAIKPVPGLNDKKTKDKVRGFDWIDTEEIRS